MITPEIFAQIPKPQLYYADGARDLPSQEDLMLASAGIEPGIFGFLLYVYAGNEAARHNFFAGLFMAAMQDLTVHRWILNRKSQGGYHRGLEALCVLAVDEWGNGHYTHQHRAQLMGVSRGTWNRKYRDIYQYILSIPKQWESEVSLKLTQRLK